MDDCAILDSWQAVSQALSVRMGGMKRIAWTTDLHLDFLDSASQITAFCRSLVETKPDGVLIGGDTAIATTLENSLRVLERELRCPIYFVLGNHDFYKSSMAAVHSTAIRLSNHSRWLRWLSHAGVIELTPSTGLVGHDGWADGRLGNSIRSDVTLSDYFLIQDLSDLPKAALFAKLNALGEQAARALKPPLLSAVTRFPHVLLLTHVPPFKEACWYEGHISDDEFLPHFTCGAIGDLLRQVMPHYPECQLTVLCGHTHGQGQVTILPNLVVKTGGAEYGRPRLNELIVVE